VIRCGATAGSPIWARTFGSGGHRTGCRSRWSGRRG